ncbi:MAG: serine hydrolase [Vicinamibacterales bacterium]|jgi:CubicO group peptidase (beta-lactamase class C family)|nr:serine hydrolase [Acidobacteriota bacterium]MDP7294590.1 serine hydrolase [Vicinamibacterales bacterium]MDP7472078.1 serine hydrolase [Vicinamibacterales bacterium]MDP7672046.1 serine hydrolase [Vicinamibacterales bacterium]HJO39199.1 serine hydrolase [Vicinamibacterales bacterium]|tara:strand:- start:447 stop:1937 length:1491 start_codon:yes stop_codon:yes gene_type:complete
MRHARAALVALLAVGLLLPGSALAQQEENYDYWRFNRQMIRYGQQAIFMCNGLFTSGRTVEQVFAQELAFLPQPVGTPHGGDYVIDEERKAVAIGAAGGTPIMHAAFREGIGCVILAPDQTFEDIDSLPSLVLPPPPGDPATIAWPDGDLVADDRLPPGVDAAALQAASNWAFDRESSEQVTLSLLVVRDGRILHERYAPGVNVDTRTRTWSTAKSIGVTLIGMLVDEGRMALDAPLGLEWLPRARSPETDPRNAITLRHVLNMSSGLDTIDNNRLEYATGSGLSYWAGASSIIAARRRALIREPGTNWDYENYDTLLAIYAMKLAIGDDQEYLQFPRRALLDRIGMRNTLVSTDRFGDFVLSSQVYTNARDLARFGLLYLQNGVWNGERLISEAWIDFVRTPAPATAARGNHYGGQFWLVPDDRMDVPTTAYSTSGNRGQYVVIVPSHDLVIVRRGLDYGRQGFSRWDLTREVLKALGPDATEEQPADRPQRAVR